MCSMHDALNVLTQLSFYVHLPLLIINHAHKHRSYHLFNQNFLALLSTFSLAGNFARVLSAIISLLHLPQTLRFVTSLLVNLMFSLQASVRKLRRLCIDWLVLGAVVADWRSFVWLHISVGVTLLAHEVMSVYRFSSAAKRMMFKTYNKIQAVLLTLTFWELHH